MGQVLGLRVEDDFDVDRIEGADEGAVRPVAAARGREAAVERDADARRRGGQPATKRRAARCGPMLWVLEGPAPRA
jgi:hypothetical protein